MSADPTAFDFHALRRHPDIEAPNLQAYDATDRYLLETAAERGLLEGTITVVGDRHGALTLGALAAGAQTVLVHQDSLTGSRALLANAARLGFDLTRIRQLPLNSELVAGSRLILLQLPRSLDALDEIAAVLASAPSDAVLLAGGRIKHMHPSMNDVLARSFGRIDVLHARQKSRILAASQPNPDAVSRWPRSRRHTVPGLGLELDLVAHAAAFGGAALDPGAVALLAHLPRMRQAAEVIDLGCGSGVLSMAMAITRPEVRVLATDVSAAAAASARLTASANGVADRVSVRQADGLEDVAAASANLILLNPPFHIGAAVHTGIAERLISDAGRALAADGELWCVWNSHLRYRPLLAHIGPTEQIGRDRTFTVTVTRR